MSRPAKLAALLAAAAALAGAPALACQPAARAAVSIASLPNPAVNSSESMTNLTHMDRAGYYYFPFGSVVLGLYVPNPSVSIQGPVKVSSLESGGFRACRTSVTVSYRYDPVIYVASELAAENPCVHNEILRHEMGHHKILVSGLRSSAVAEAASQVLAQRPLYAESGDAESAAASLAQIEDLYLMEAREAIGRFVYQTQAAHDSENEYVRLANACSGGLQELLKNSWSGYIYGR